MAKYSGVFLCGHKGIVDVIGPHKDRLRKIEKAFSRYCPECYEKIQKEKLEQAKKDLAFKIQEYEFPELIGSTKQIEWANSIRIKFFDKFPNSRIVYEMIQRELKASFWIDSEYWLFDEDFLNKYRKSQQNKTRRKLIIDMDAVAPENVTHDGTVEIVKKFKKVCLFYLKDDDFIALVKKYHYKWDSGESYWYRELSELTGNYEDRAAEIGHALLLNGFCISIHDEEVLEKAINKDFKKEFFRWILWENQTKSLVIYWTVKHNESYEAARKIRDNKYDYGRGVVTVPIMRYRSVNNLAKKFDFQFTEDALDAIEQYKTERREMRKVQVKK